MADAHGSGPCDSNIMRVQVPFPALILTVKGVPSGLLFEYMNILGGHMNEFKDILTEVKRIYSVLCMAEDELSDPVKEKLNTIIANLENWINDVKSESDNNKTREQINSELALKYKYLRVEFTDLFKDKGILSNITFEGKNYYEEKAMKLSYEEIVKHLKKLIRIR